MNINIPHPDQTDECQKNLENKKKCFTWIIDNYRSQIIKTSKQITEDSQFVEIKVNVISEDQSAIEFSVCKMGMIDFSAINEFDISNEQKEFYKKMYQIQHSLAEDTIKLAKRKKEIPIVCFWFYDECPEMYSVEQPSFIVDTIPYSFSWGENETTKKTIKKVVSKPKEKDLESELLKWLFSYGVMADNQVITSRYRTDIWIIGKCFLELKRGKVSGDDVCQAINYFNEYRKPIILVGESISSMASKGIESFNSITEETLIHFVQWSSVKIFLKGFLNLR